MESANGRPPSAGNLLAHHDPFNLIPASTRNRLIMISKLPIFREGVNWRELSPEEGKFRWRFEILRPISLDLDLPLRQQIGFFDREGRKWASFDSNRFTIEAGYRTRGVRPKRWFRIQSSGCAGWLGMPDFRGGPDGQGGNLLASTFLDACRQFANTRHMPLSSREVNMGYYQILRLAGFIFALSYHTVAHATSGRRRGAENGSYSLLGEKAPRGVIMPPGGAPEHPESRRISI